MSPATIHPTTGERIPQLVILIGIQASGKTSFYREHFLGSHVRISLDLLRTRNREMAFLSLCLETRMDTVVDNTNPTAIERARYIAPAKAAGFHVHGFYFQSRVSDALARNAQRQGDARIPDVGVLGCAKRLELPSRAESFDQLSYVTMVPISGFQIQEWNDGL
ncbi:MAG: AAA family ATPase [Planctomycetes bacterium]|nr:AAA family ATPase [Planctomycetota bacterium]